MGVEPRTASYNMPISIVIDAAKHFGVAVDACLFVASMRAGAICTRCGVYPDLDANAAHQTIGFHDGLLLADVDAFARRATCAVVRVFGGVPA